MSLRALLLAAGVGSRLRPFTDVLPKCLMPIQGRPLLEYWLKLLIQGGITEILINTHHHADLVERYIRGSEFSPYVQLVYEPELLLTGGTLLANHTFFKGGPVLLAHADNLTHFSVSEFFQAHRNRPASTSLTMMTFESLTPETCGIVQLNSQGIVEAFFEKVKNPPGTLANAAVYLLEEAVFDFLSSLNQQKIDFSTEVLPHYLGKIFTYLNSGYHQDIGNPASYFQAQICFPLYLQLQKTQALEPAESWQQLLRQEAILGRFSQLKPWAG